MTNLKNKHIAFPLILLCLTMVSPVAKSQLDLSGILGSIGLGGLFSGQGGLLSGPGLGGLLGGLLGGGQGGGGGGLLGGILGGQGGGLLGGILGGQGGLLGGLLGGQGGLLGGLLSGQRGGQTGGVMGVINVAGIVHCSINGDASAPVFPNARVQLQCGSQNTVVATSSATTAGVFSILINPTQVPTSVLLSGCKLAVTTPLSTCDASLPSVGQLLSPLKSLGETVTNVLRITSLGPTGFALTQ